MVLSSAALLLVSSLACAPAAPAPQAPSWGTRRGAGRAGSGAAAQGAAQRPSATSHDWETLVAAAKREGKVNCTCVPFPAVRDAVLAEWAKDYPEIQMEYSFATLPDI